MTAPRTLRDALERIAELEHLLEVAQNGGAVPEWRRVANLLGLSPSQAAIVVILSRAVDPLSLEQLDAMLPDDLPDAPGNGPGRKDPDFRTLSTMKQQLYRVRRHYTALLAPPHRGRYGGVWLTETGRLVIKDILSGNNEADLSVLQPKELASAVATVGGMG